MARYFSADDIIVPPHIRPVEIHAKSITTQIQMPDVASDHKQTLRHYLNNKNYTVARL